MKSTNKTKKDRIKQNHLLREGGLVGNGAKDMRTDSAMQHAVLAAFTDQPSYVYKTSEYVCSTRFRN